MKKQINAGIVIEHFSNGRGGAERWTWDFANWLAGRVSQLHVIARTFDSRPANPKIIQHQVSPGASRCGFADEAAQAARAAQLDVVHDCGNGWFGDIILPHGGSRTAYLRQYLKLKHPLVRPFSQLAIRHLPRYKEFDRLASRQFGSREATYIALSNMVAEHLREHHNISDRQIRTIYNGVDIERFSPDALTERRDTTRAQLGIKPEETCLLMVAHNLKLKGAATLIRAASGLTNVKLLIVGSKRFGGYRKLARRNRVNAVFSGAVDDPLEFYAAGDIYVQPTFYDPCSLVVLEALACGLPVITSQNNGAGELITPGNEGYVVSDPADHRELHASLGKVIGSNSLDQMKHSARQLAEQNSQQRNFEQLISLYEEIAVNKSSANDTGSLPATDVGRKTAA